MAYMLKTLGLHSVSIPCNGDIEIRGSLGEVMSSGRFVKRVVWFAQYLIDRSGHMFILTRASVWMHGQPLVLKPPKLGVRGKAIHVHMMEQVDKVPNKTSI